MAAADVGWAVIGMKTLCLDPTVLGDWCWRGSVAICPDSHFLDFFHLDKHYTLTHLVVKEVLSAIF